MFPPDQRKEVEQLRKELSKLGTDFDTNIVKVNAPVIFTGRFELLPESFVRRQDHAYTVMANVTWQFNTVEENAKSEATRKQLYVISGRRWPRRRTFLFSTRCSRFGTRLHCDWVTNRGMTIRRKLKMAKTGANAEKCISELVTGIQPKFESEVSELQKLKAAETNDSNAKIEAAGTGAIMPTSGTKQKYAVRQGSVACIFPVPKRLDGMFNIYQSIFGLKFEKIAAPYNWIDDLQLYMRNCSTGGTAWDVLSRYVSARIKFNHFAQFEIISGKLLPDGNNDQLSLCFVIFLLRQRTSHL